MRLIGEGLWSSKEGRKIMAPLVLFGQVGRRPNLGFGLGTNDEFFTGVQLQVVLNAKDV